MDKDRLGEALQSISYPQDKINYLVNGFKWGFALGVPLQLTFNTCRNHPTATKNITVLVQKINKELKGGCWVGPYDHPL